MQKDYLPREGQRCRPGSRLFPVSEKNKSHPKKYVEKLKVSHFFCVEVETEVEKKNHGNKTDRNLFWGEKNWEARFEASTKVLMRLVDENYYRLELPPNQ